MRQTCFTYPKIWTFSSDNVFFEDKQPTQAVLKQNYTNMYQVKSHQKSYLRSKLNKCLSVEKKNNTKMRSKNAEYEKKKKRFMKLVKLMIRSTALMVEFSATSYFSLPKRRLGEMWGKILIGKVSQELGWKLQSGKGF